MNNYTSDPKSLIEQLSNDAQDVVLYGQFDADGTLLNTMPECEYREPGFSRLDELAHIVAESGITTEEAARAFYQIAGVDVGDLRASLESEHFEIE